jgi:uncharacterized protein
MPPWWRWPARRRASSTQLSARLFPGSVSAAYGYRRELVGQRSRLLRLAPASTLGAITGAVLLLNSPPTTFKKIVPFLILIGVVLVIVQPMVQARLRAARANAIEVSTIDGAAPASSLMGPISAALRVPSGCFLQPASRIGAPAVVQEKISFLIVFLVFLTGIYGGYFGAGQGVILVGMLGMALDDSLLRINATKNVLAAIVNGVAAFVFILVRPIPWWVAIILAVSSVIGAQVGSLVGRRIPPNVLRGVIVVVGLIAATKLFLGK